MWVTFGELSIGIAAIAGGTTLLLRYRLDARRKAEMVAELKRREIIEFSSRFRSDRKPKGTASRSFTGNGHVYGNVSGKESTKTVNQTRLGKASPENRGGRRPY